MPYAIISLGGKQHRVQEGERLIVDRIPTAEGKTFHPQILLAGGDGDPVLAPSDIQVTARVVKHDLGPKIRIGKYRKRTGYRRHNGHRSRVTQIEIESIGKKAARKPAAKKDTEESSE
jgi:large subunit ribosomal protein L21